MKHWALIDLEEQIIQYLEYPEEAYPLRPTVPHRPRWAERIAKKRIRLYEPPDIMRYTLALTSIPLRREYYKPRATLFVLEKDYEEKRSEIEDFVFDELKSFIEEFLGYTEEEFWFELEIEEEEWVAMKGKVYELKLAIEKKGAVVVEDTRYVEDEIKAL